SRDYAVVGSLSGSGAVAMTSSMSASGTSRYRSVNWKSSPVGNMTAVAGAVSVSRYSVHERVSSLSAKMLILTPCCPPHRASIGIVRQEYRSGFEEHLWHGACLIARWGPVDLPPGFCGLVPVRSPMVNITEELMSNRISRRTIVGGAAALPIAALG